MNCELCGEPMPEGESMFKFHGYSGPCPKPPLRRAPASSNAWRTAIEDELICAHLGTVDSFPDAKSALQNLIDWHVSVALDPAVSSKAQALVDRGKAAQPAEPVAWDAALNTLAQVFHNGEEAEGDDGAA